MTEEKVVDVEVTEDDENRLPTKVTEAKEGLMAKAMKHKKLIIGGLIAGGAIIAAKIIHAVKGNSGSADVEDKFDDDFDESFDSDDSTSVTDEE